MRLTTRQHGAESAMAQRPEGRQPIGVIGEEVNLPFADPSTRAVTVTKKRPADGTRRPLVFLGGRAGNRTRRPAGRAGGAGAT